MQPDRGSRATLGRSTSPDATKPRRRPVRAEGGGYDHGVAAEDDEIDTRTIWLPFEDGETAISIDLTGWNRAMRRVEEATAALRYAGGISPPARASCSPHAPPG